jgi:hypothetical protein
VFTLTTTKELRLSDGLTTKLSVASAAYGMSSHDFILAAVEAALETCAENDEPLARVLAYVDEREKQPT